MSVPAARVEAVVAALRQRELDWLLVSDSVNVRWLTGFTGSNGVALVAATGEGHRFVTDFRYLSQSAEQVSDAFARDIHHDLLETAAGAIAGRVGFDDASMPVRQLRRLEGLVADGVVLDAAGGLVEDLRAIKDEDEIAKIRAAAALADDALEAVLARGVVGRTERDVALDLEVEMRRAGAEGVSFPPIIAAGAHGALPHASPRDVAIPAGTLLVVDWGAQLDGYASDCTRTYATGELDPRDAAVYDVVLAAQLAALDAVKPGPTGREVDAVARRIIDEAGHAEHFGHGLGHGVGLAVHEGPRLSKQGETKLAPGMVVTVEPGVYVPGAVGVRIEDLVVVRDGEPEVLSRLPKDLTQVG